MANDDDAGVPDSSDGGVTGPHPDVDLMDLLVAPATGDESNRVKLPLIPIACWKIEDIRFAFETLQHDRDAKTFGFATKGPSLTRARVRGGVRY